MADNLLFGGSGGGVRPKAPNTGVANKMFVFSLVFCIILYVDGSRRESDNELQAE